MTDLEGGANSFHTVYDLELSSDGMKLILVTRNNGMMQIKTMHTCMTCHHLTIFHLAHKALKLQI